MPKTNKRQIGFYADLDVEEYLDSLDLGVKTRTINAALRAWKESRGAVEMRDVYEDKLESLVAWLNGLRPPITVSDQVGETISLGGLLERFLLQERQRKPSKSWWQLAAEGVTFEAPPYRCTSCNKTLLAAEAINTPSRGVLCRQCFDLPFPRRATLPNHPDFERYANDTVLSWIRAHGDKKIDKTFAEDEYNDLPKYMQKQINVDQYYSIVERCWNDVRQRG